MACVRIERAENGYTVSMTDPKIEAANRKRDAKGNGPYTWQDPNREYVFETFDSMKSFLQKNLDKALPAQDYDTVFSGLSDEDDD